jgi:hypothetical protein
VSEPDFFAVGLNVESHSDAPYVRLTFSDDDDKTRAVIIHQSNLPSAISALHEKISSPNVVPIDRASLKQGQDYVVTGFSAKKLPEGAELTVHLNLPDQGRFVTLAMALSPQDITGLVLQLSGALPKSGHAR